MLDWNIFERIYLTKYRCLKFTGHLGRVLGKICLEKSLPKPALNIVTKATSCIYCMYHAPMNTPESLDHSCSGNFILSNFVPKIPYRSARLIGQNFGGQKFQKSDLLQTLSAEKICLPKFCPLKYFLPI